MMKIKLKNLKMYSCSW